MKIVYYMPFKPLGHAHPSGDLVIGTELFEYLRSRHDIALASTLRCRWIYYRPDLLVQLAIERLRLRRKMHTDRPDIWLTYHSYYKAPDLVGPYLASREGIPYVIFQGIYSTKRRKSLKTLPGFLLNRATLCRADHIFTNKKRDYRNLQRLIPTERLTCIAPGIQPESFHFSSTARHELRNRWRVGEDVVVLTVAMMRPGVKSAGISQVIETCAILYKQGQPIRLLVVGDGEMRAELEKEARQMLPDRALFIGQIPRELLFKYYSCADVFAFPGINESLGMVYLEAQSCRLPVVAFSDWGGSEAVVHGTTGLLSPAAAMEDFRNNLATLVADKNQRLELGSKAEAHVRTNHNLQKNYRKMEEILESTALTKKSGIL